MSATPSANFNKPIFAYARKVLENLSNPSEPLLITVQRLGETTTIILQPNRSMSWRANQWLLLSFWVLSLIIGVGFALIGAWTILPFAGIEMTLLSIALYYVSWKLSYREVLVINDASIRLEKGVYRPKKVWQWPHHDIRLRIKTAQREFDRDELMLCNTNESISIGECLNQDQCRELLSVLRKEERLFISGAL